MAAKDIALKKKEFEAEYGIKPVLSIADASIWDKEKSKNDKVEVMPSVAETMAKEGIYYNREKSIDAKKSRLQGKQQVHSRLRVDEDGLASLFVYSNCTHWWRTVPVLPVDELRPEDVDTDVEDHAYDETRYMCSARPFKTIIKKKTDPMALANLDRLYFPNKRNKEKAW
jgi:hypothetical protein